MRIMLQNPLPSLENRYLWIMFCGVGIKELVWVRADNHWCLPPIHPDRQKLSGWIKICPPGGPIIIHRHCSTISEYSDITEKTGYFLHMVAPSKHTYHKLNQHLYFPSKKPIIVQLVMSSLFLLLICSSIFCLKRFKD